MKVGVKVGIGICVSLVLLVVLLILAYVIPRAACYGPLGLFNNEAPYDNAKAPDCRDDVGTEFYLYNAKNGLTIYHPDNIAGVKSSLFPTNRDVKIIIHGLRSSCKEAWVKDMVEEYHKKDAFTVVCVNWEKGADYLLNYEQAAGNTRLVAAEIVLFLTTIDIEPSRVHMIGHSLGAHTAGHVGQKLDGIGRITGLDPAEPNFQFMDPHVRLSSIDANFVDVIHTDAEPFIVLSGYGLEQVIGDVDFYPNGGRKQPGCIEITCDHSRAYYYFIESINSPCRFTGYPCRSLEQWNAGDCTSCGASGCAEMGEHVNKTQRGVYFLSTLPNSPHCASQYRVNITFGSGNSSSAGYLTMTLTGTGGSDVFMDYDNQNFWSSRSHVFLVGLSNVGTIQEVKVVWIAEQELSKNTTGSIRIDQFEVFDVSNNKRYKSCDSLLIDSNTSDNLTLSC